MVKINNIVLEINQSLCDAFSSIPGVVLHKLARTADVKRGAKTISMPAVLLENGDYEYVGFDCTYPLSGYHKLNRLTSQFATNPKENYGRDLGRYKNIYSLSLFLNYDQTVLKAEPDELYMIVLKAIQNDFKIEGFNSVTARVNEAIFDSKTVFSKEYKGSEETLPIEKVMLEIVYTIEGTFNQNCLDNCLSLLKEK